MFTDSEGGVWVSNGNGTYRCISAEVESMTLAQIMAEFGCVRPSVSTDLD